MTTISYYILTTVLALIIAHGFAMKEGNAPLEPKRQRGMVGYVIDGDTVILRGGQETRLRLWSVDAPESDQTGFHEARNRLVAIAEDQPITFIQMGTDRYGRTVARVFLRDGREINRLMIESGTAKEYCRYSKGFYGHC